jgi:hypothetical protein
MGGDPLILTRTRLDHEVDDRCGVSASSFKLQAWLIFPRSGKHSVPTPRLRYCVGNSNPGRLTEWTRQGPIPCYLPTYHAQVYDVWRQRLHADPPLDRRPINGSLSSNGEQTCRCRCVIRVDIFIWWQRLQLGPIARFRNVNRIIGDFQNILHGSSNFVCPTLRILRVR